ncbi:hypothetical protein G9P44_005256 [Scheffersomyces stipitis]|nr:hypothetical protein G9P44_005256 [Scheffersomyces stipitis]
MARFTLKKKTKKNDDSANTTAASIEPQPAQLQLPQTPKSPKSIKGMTVPHSRRLSNEEDLKSALISHPVKINVNQTTPWKRFKVFDSPFPRYRHVAASVASEKDEIFLMGGLKEGSVFGDTWTIIPRDEHGTGEATEYIAKNIEIVNHNNPPARVGHSSVLCGNAFIIYGGDTVDTDFNGFPDNNFYLFNINNNKYTIPSHILNKPNGRYGHTIGVISTANNSSRLYLFGGQLENDVFNDLYYFELNSFKSPKAKWELVEPVNNFKPPPLTNHSMCVYKSKIYIFGGVYNNERVSSDLWCYDSSNNKWSQMPTTGNVPLPVNEHSCCIVNDKMYIYGGNDFSGVIYDSLFVLDLNTYVWYKLVESATAQGPGPRCGHSMTYIPRFNKLVVMGGDKNDYINSDADNFDTYENFNGEEIGTMIYELDVNIIDYFLTDKVESVPTPSANAVDAASSPVAAAKSVLPKKTAASASNGPSKREENPEGFERHARSFSAGPEDYKTPQASVSPERTRASVYDANINTDKDKFVEVDVPSSSAVSQHDTYHEGSTYPAESTRDILAGESRFAESSKYVDSPRNGHSSYRDDYNYAAINEPVVSESREVHHERTSSLPKPVSRFSQEPEEKAIVASPASNGGNGHEDSRIKMLVSELSNELTQLKATTKAQMQNATENINRLEQENSSLKANQSTEASGLRRQLQEKNLLIDELKAAVNPRELAIDEDAPQDQNTPVSELNKYKLERLELNNKIIYLEEENALLNDKIVQFQPFMDNQIGELSNFQKIIKAQEEKIERLTAQVKDEEHLRRELNDWQAKYNNLNLEYENYKSIHADDDISDVDEDFASPPDLSGPADSSNRSIVSNATSIRRSKKDISLHLENLVNSWNRRNDLRETSSIASSNPEDNPMVQKLQKQVDDLLKVGKQNELQSSSQIDKLRNDLNEKLVNLKTFEVNYRDALQSVNNTSKALKINQEELNNQKAIMEKLIKENNELKLYKKANKRISSRAPTPVTTDPSGIPEVDEEDEEEVISSVHYNMKVKDLEADLYILKQERDGLKESVTNLQKQLYLAQNSH